MPFGVATFSDRDIELLLVFGEYRAIVVVHIENHDFCSIDANVRRDEFTTGSSGFA